MAWFFAERRGPQWKHGWREQTLASLSLPPPQLIAIFAIVILFLSVSWYGDYKTQVRRTETSFRFLLFLLPAALIVIARYVVRDSWFVFRLPRARRESIHPAGSSPWGVLLLVLVLLVMVSYQSSFHAQWFRPLWRVD
ncbi:uncharacterized protein LOC135672581 [Musa acuminata AAA Group]|uniref:uncharacterized protein LOC135672581 n=1 Tax=Musa acuminata AAA Group TaxID=214697 RepID=UPI0031DC7858